jgi:histidinol-phosphate/aromatic aminotransferase/cobyric acid decarboxylase-like protein
MSKVTEDPHPPVTHPVTQLIALKTGVTDSMVGLFSDFETLLIRLIEESSPSTGRIIAAGHVTPEVQLAVHKADKTLAEIVAVSPFTSDVTAVLAAISDSTETVFVSNPNRITGAGWSLGDLELLAEAIPDGMLIIDEFYYDYHGISADPLLTRYSNVVVLRSPASARGLPGACGYLIASPHRVDQLTQARAVGNPAEADLSVMTECLYDTERLFERLRGIHDEALRMVGELTRLGFQCRLTPYDHLLVKVGNPAVAGNHLAGHKVAVENLDGYPGLKYQVRVKIGSPSTNDRTIESFIQLAGSGMSTQGRGRQTLQVRRKPEPVASTIPVSSRAERVKAFETVVTDSEKASSR